MPGHGAGGVRARRALCIAYSGRCLLSGYFNRRDPTRAPAPTPAAGTTDPPPTKTPTQAGAGRGGGLQGFSFADEQQRAEQDGASDLADHRHPAADKVYLIEEEGRPGQLMPVMEDEHGTYIANSGTCARSSWSKNWPDRRRFTQRSRPHQKPVLRGTHRAGVPPRHRRRGGRPPSTAVDHRAGRPGQPRLHQRLPGAPPGMDYQNYRDRPFGGQRSSSSAK